MKRIIISLLIILMVMNNGVCFCCFANENNLKIDDKEVESIYFRYSSGQGRPEIIDEEYKKNHFEFQTTSANEIKYIVHYLNSLSLIDDGQKYNGGGDIPIINISITKKDSTDKMGFVRERFYDINDNQYKTDSNEYKRFLDFIYAIKTGTVILNNEVTFEPSEWAKEDIDYAISKNFVPEWNQIDYTGNISRLDVCQLIDNLLTIKGVKTDSERSTLFEDASFPDVIRLYQYGIVNGKTDTKFAPYDFITREEAAKILSETCKILNINQSATSHIYDDNKDISDWAKNGVDLMYQTGIMQGDENNKFRPKDNLKREELIVSILRLSKL